MRISRPLLSSGAVVATLALGLTGCGSAEKKGDTDSKAGKTACEKVESGKASDAVKVKGEFGKKHTLDFDKGLKATGVQRTVLTEGDGKTPKDGDNISVLLTVASGKSGKTFTTQMAEFPVGNKEIPLAFAAGVECLKIGSRSVVTASATEVYGAQGNPNVGIAADDSLIIVTDMIEKLAAPETPEPAPLPKVAEWKDAPEVTFGKGNPEVKLTGKPSTKLQLAVLDEGDGDEVKSGDEVTVHYRGLNWNTGKEFDSSYGRGEPATFNTGGVVPGFGAALVGQKVGSKLIVAIPAEYGYGPSGGNPGAGIGAKDTIVFVIEIKAVG